MDGEGDPGGAVLADRVEIDVLIGHEVVEDFHAAILIEPDEGFELGEGEGIPVLHVRQVPARGSTTVFAPGISC